MTNDHGVQRSACPHCPDGHDDPAIKPWGVYVAADRDGDGQPLRLTVQPSDGSHVAESDAEWLWQLINDEAVLRAHLRFATTHPRTIRCPYGRPVSTMRCMGARGHDGKCWAWSGATRVEWP